MRLAAPHRGSEAKVAAAVAQVVRVVQRTPDGERLDWIVDVPADLAAPIDHDDLSEALGNLIENAADFANREVRLRARWSAAELIVDVMDDGPGFAAEIFEQIGEPYVTSRPSGRGLVPVEWSLSAPSTIAGITASVTPMFTTMLHI